MLLRFVDMIEECEWTNHSFVHRVLEILAREIKAGLTIVFISLTSVSLLSSKLGQSIQPDKVAEPDKARGNDRSRIHLLLR